MLLLSYRNNTVETGLGLEALATALKDLGKANPGATVDVAGRHGVFHWHRSSGTGRAIVKIQGQDDLVMAMPLKRRGKAGPQPLTISLPCILHLHPDNGPAATVAISASGSYRVAQGDTAPDVLEENKGDSTMVRNAKQWLREGKVGVSSYALCATLTGVRDPNIREPAAPDVPWDVADFSRCMAFFQAVPEARPNLAQMEALDPLWVGMVAQWEAIEQCIQAGDRAGAGKLINKALGRQASGPRHGPA